VTITLKRGDCRLVLPTLPADGFDCVVTSPPYWGLRNYGVDGQIGLEPTLDAYLDTMVGVFRDVRRALKPSGTCWVNVGDCYTSGGRATYRSGASDNKGHRIQDDQLRPDTPAGLKPKDLCLVPYRLAILLQQDGWWVRQCNIWAKPNPMPESVIDRTTSAFEVVWHLTKSERYFYDAAAIAEGAASDHKSGNGYARPEQKSRGGRGQSQGWDNVGGQRNCRNVWTIASQPYAGAHFATMPPALAERCIKAGCPKGGQVLDPFGGAGTTGLVADRLGRHATLIDISAEYAAMQRERLTEDAPLFVEIIAGAA
jgi:DNA modification methylase